MRDVASAGLHSNKESKPVIKFFNENIKAHSLPETYINTLRWYLDELPLTSTQKRSNHGDKNHW